MSKEPVLTESERAGGITQEIILKPDGTAVIPWIAPEASKLVREIWLLLNNKESFPVQGSPDTKIYCG